MIIHAPRFQNLCGSVCADDIAFYPRAFFVAWNGVLTLAFRGFTSATVDLKVAVTRAFGLRAENSGSKWPKCTLGCLRDGLQLSLEQLEKLHEVCARYEQYLAQSPDLVFSPQCTSLVVFQCRSLEKQLLRVDFPFKITSLSESKHLPVIPASEFEKVSSVLAEFALDNLSTYLPLVNKEGNRASHYRLDHCETALVCFLDSDRQSRSQSASIPMIQETIAAFRHDVDALLPNYYEWFEPNCLHVTLRTVC